MTDYLYTTITGSGTSFNLNPVRGSVPAKLPAALIATKAVQTKDGWFGQVIVDKKIVWESGSVSSGDIAIELANGHVVEKITGLLVEP